jgi:DNA-binding CsgD family transcriptional regulator
MALSARAMARMLDVVDYGMLLLLDDARVAYANAVARDELAGDHPLRLQDGLLVATQPADATALRGALHAAARRCAQSLLTLGGPSGPRVSVSVVPMGEPGELPATLLVLGKRQACEMLSREAFARHHGLTMAEARVLDRLCDGERPSAIAERLGVKLTTVRTQIGSIRAKTGARDIGQIVQLVSRLPPLPCLMRRAT